MQNIDDKQWKNLKKKLSRCEQFTVPPMGDPEKEYILSRGIDILRLHATDFVKKRIAPADPKNEGRQTPRKGHPVFIAQHATGTSDRAHLEKFHGIQSGIELSEKEIAYIVSIILRWIQEQVGQPSCAD